MGLDFSHCDAHWSYSGFMRFRAKLAAEVGIALHCMESFAYTAMGEKCESLVIYNHDQNVRPPVGIVGIQPVIKWSSVHDDIVPFLNHSDCDGVLTPEECKQIAPRLRELVSGWDDDDRDKTQALELADGMEYAVKLNEPIEFI